MTAPLDTEALASLPACELIEWGRIGYDEAVERMERRVAARRAGLVEDALILLEHDPVITLGRNAREEHLLASRAELERRGILVRECGRGGDVTYHGPGQLVGYPVIALEPSRHDAHLYLRQLEDTLIWALAELGVRGERRPGLTGVWVGRSKLASLGVRLSRWVTSHGFALNVAGALEGFRDIVPCGIQGCEIASLERLLGWPVSLEEVRRPIAWRFGGVFGRRMVVPPAASGRPEEREKASELVERAADRLQRGAA